MTQARFDVTPSRPTTQITPKQLIGGSAVLLVTLGLLSEFKGFPALSSTGVPGLATDTRCNQVQQSQARLNDKQFAAVLGLQRGQDKAKVRTLVPAPYCTLPSVQMRQGATADRELYPLAKNSAISVVLLYEDNQYVDYQLVSH
jgi:hypothetical protein